MKSVPYKLKEKEGKRLKKKKQNKKKLQGRKEASCLEILLYLPDSTAPLGSWLFERILETFPEVLYSL